MATQKQIRANRSNAARCTGPVTPEGKKVASQNTTRHGMLAQTVVLDGESKSRFEELVISFMTQYNPRTPAETAIVETMAIAFWKQMRTWGMQKASLRLEMARLSPDAGDPSTRAAIAFTKQADNSRAMDLIHRYETGYNRQFHRVFAILAKLRQNSPARSDDPALSAAALIEMPLAIATATWLSAEEAAQEEAEANQAAHLAAVSPSETPQAKDLPKSKPVLPYEPNSSKSPHQTSPQEQVGRALACARLEPRSSTSTKGAPRAPGK